MLAREQEHQHDDAKREWRVIPVGGGWVDYFTTNVARGTRGYLTPFAFAFGSVTFFIALVEAATA